MIFLMPQEIPLVCDSIQDTSAGEEQPFPPSRDGELGVPATAGELPRSKKEQHSKGSSMKGLGKISFL